MQPTDLALSQALGLVATAPEADHLLELPLTPLILNHVGTVHAAAQFALAEAAGAAGLQRAFPQFAGSVYAVVRGVRLKYRHSARTKLRAFAVIDEETRCNLANDLATRTRARATVHVELKDESDVVCFSGSFDWFIARNDPAG